ncbi:MAG: hypothetical protein ABIE42_09225 [Candidatus Eisenbacteria bacterium]
MLGELALQSLSGRDDFDTWKRKVSALVSKKYGVEADDLPDIDYYSHYEDGMSPAQVVTGPLRRMLREEGY